MAKSDYAKARDFFGLVPNIYTELQKLVVAMSDVYKSRGKRTFFGKSKEKKAFEKFYERLYYLMIAMKEDSLILVTTASDECRKKVLTLIEMFGTCFPNWQDAYSVAHWFFVEDKEQTIGGIDLIREKIFGCLPN